MSMAVGLVIVSHSSRLADGVAELAEQMAQGKTPIAAAGGAMDDVLGTSTDKILEAIQSVDGPDGVLVLLDLGSAILSAEMVLEMLSDEQRARIRLSYAPLVEGAVAAALEASLGRTLAQVQQVAEMTANVEQIQKLKPLTPTENVSGEIAASPEGNSIEGTSELTVQLTLTNPTGLHARPASLFVQTSAGFQAIIHASGRGKETDATSIFGVMSLGLRQGDTLTIRASGKEAEAAIEALSELVRANFHEPTSPIVGADVSLPSPMYRPGTLADADVSRTPPIYRPAQLPGEPWRGIPVSAGIAVGPTFMYSSNTISLNAIERLPISTEQVTSEQQRLREALLTAAKELRTLARELQNKVGQADAAIFEAQALMLLDPALGEATLHVIETAHVDAAGALAEAGEHYATMLETLDDPLIAGRAVDMRDAVRRALQHVTNQHAQEHVLSGLSRPVILMAWDLTPSDTAQLKPEFVLGICTVQGGPTTHAAIIARALEIPAVAGLDPHLLEIIHDGQQIAIDGSKGFIYVHPDGTQQDALYTEMLQQQQARNVRRSLNSSLWRTRPGSTADGHKAQIFANVGDVESARAAAESGAEGIGLLRTEFLFGGRTVFPDEQEQFESYVALFRAFADHTILGKTIVARTLDAGADKPFPALEPLIGALQEFNPALGLRGVRIHLLYEELLCQQLRALLRAGTETGVQLHIMFPMIATIEEIRRLRMIFTSVQNGLKDEGIALPASTQVGIMIETPAAALMANALAREVDFFSIGANDLYQYTMAADRTNTRVTGMFGMLEPAVWRLIERVIRAGVEHGKLVALCGELAADPRIGPLLVGLGVQELSMNPPAIVNVKAALHTHTLEHWRKLSHKLLEAETAAEIQSILQTMD
jgi:phosphoenolpyruvate-protein phosphotransferase/dihydroxyacetone kinase phosphotransfer subunit